MSAAILDASALLASLQQERGCDEVDAVLHTACISSVNLAEVITKLTLDGLSAKEIEAIFNELGLNVVTFDEDRAVIAGLMVAKTRKFGLSLGDRACLVLGVELGLPVLTTDRAWAKVDCGARVELIR